MRHPLLPIVLAAALAGCAGTPDDTDDTEVIDTDDTEETEPPCGNGTPDPGEQCDEGDANGPDGECGATCDWNGWVTCDMLTGPIETLDTTTAQPDGSFHATGRFTGLVALDSACVTDPDHSAVVEFTLPAAGDWMVTTAHPGTTSHTALSLRTDCDDRAELSCNLDDAPVAGTSQAFITGGAQGDAYVALLELVDGDARGWQLSLRPIDGVAALGAACDTSNPCGDDAVCTPSDAGDVCVADAAPSVDTVTVVQSDVYSLRVTVTGTDPNRDVTGIEISRFTDILGDVWGDAANEPALPVTSGKMTWSGDTFTWVYTEGVMRPETGMDLFDTVTYRAVDRAGGVSAGVAATWPELVEIEVMSLIGDPCDMCVECDDSANGFPRYCDPNAHPDPADADHEIVGLVCTWDAQPGVTATCQDRNVNAAPVLTAASMAWRGETPWITVSGFEAVHDRGFTAHVTFVYTDESEESAGSPYLHDITWDRGAFTVSGAADLQPSKTVHHLALTLEDNGYPSATSEPIEVAWVSWVAPVTVAAGGACDLRGWDSVCEAPSVCSPTLSGHARCAASAAPVLYAASGAFAGGDFFTTMTVAFDAEDPNADWQDLMIETTSGPPRPLAYDDFDSPWAPDPFGHRTYAGQSVIPFGNWIYQVWLRDADGNTSARRAVVGVGTQALGATCSTGTCSFFGCEPPLAYCDVAAGHTCSAREGTGGTVSVCEVATAPVLTSIVVRRIDADSYTVDVTGTDANGDATDVAITLDEGGEISQPYVEIDFATPLYGATAFTSTVKGSLTDASAASTVAVTLQDYAFLSSGTLTAAIPPLRGLGESCSGDDTIDTCQEGASCAEGTCQAFAPTLLSAEVTFTNHGRDGRITVTGSDDQTGRASLLESAFITVGDREIVHYLAWWDLTWDADEFTFVVDVPGLGTGDLVDVDTIEVVVTDRTGLFDTAEYPVTPHRGFGDVCDADGLDDTCHAGLTCDAGTCVNDATDPCAGVAVIEAASNTVAVDTDTGTEYERYPDYATCGVEWNEPNGREVAIEYVATDSGTLVITTTDDPSDGNVVPGWLFVRFDQCVGYDAVTACSNEDGGSNTVRVDVEAGDLLYVLVDGPGWPSGPLSVDFAYE